MSKKHRNKQNNPNRDPNSGTVIKEEVSYGITEEDVSTSLDDILEVTVEEEVTESVREQPQYVAPVVEERVTPKVVEQPKPTVKEEVTAPRFKHTEEVVKSNQMVQRNSSVITNIMLDRVEKHMKHLNGTLGFNNKQEQEVEQITFMETMGNVLKLDYERFSIVTDKLISEIRANEKVFTEGLAFRFMKGLEAKYPKSIIDVYQTYITFLTRIAVNWTKRHQLKNMIDINHVISDLNRTAKSNVTKYFNKLTSN